MFTGQNSHLPFFSKENILIAQRPPALSSFKRILLSTLLLVAPARGQESSLNDLSTDQLEKKLEGIDTQLSQLANFTMRSGVGAIGHRSKSHQTSTNPEWVEVALDDEKDIDLIVLVPTIGRLTREGLAADGFPRALRVIAGTPGHPDGEIVASLDRSDHLLPRIAPLTIPFRRQPGLPQGHPQRSIGLTSPSHLEPASIPTMQDDRFFQTNKVENHLASIFDDLPGFIYFVKDLDLRYVAYNDRLCEIFEASSPSEVLGKRDDDYIPQHIMKDIRKDDLRILETGESIVNRVELVPRGNGFVDWSNTTKKPLYNQEGKICGLIGITRPFNQGTTSLSMNEELGGALQLLHERYRENIAITELAKAAHISLSSFLRKFKACFNMTPKEYLRHLRIQEACHLIVRTTRPFAQIGLDCGFADQAHFSREFSRIMKEPPSAYRSRYRL